MADTFLSKKEKELIQVLGEVARARLEFLITDALAGNETDTNMFILADICMAIQDTKQPMRSISDEEYDEEVF